MPKTPLKASPLRIVTQDFSEVSVQAQHDSEDGANTLDVNTTLLPVEGQDRAWVLLLSVRVGADSEGKRPPYLAQVEVSGCYEVHDSYSGDPERLVRITGASILYGAAREMLCTVTSRCEHGMLTLPSVSFFENGNDTRKKKPAKKAAKRSAKKKTVKSKR